MPITGTELSTISTDTSAGSGDHGLIVLLNSSGKVDPTMLDSSGTITAVVAGTAMSGGGSSGSVTLNVTLGTSGSSAAAGNDSRLSNDRTASGLRTATTTVAISSATAPSSGQLLAAINSTSAHWVDPSEGVVGTTWYWYFTSEVMNDGDGVDGDYAIIVGGPEGNGNIYQKLTGHWTAIGNIRGDAGANGTKIRSGTTAPDDATGINGDYYLRSTTGQFYLRASGTYGLVLTMALAVTYGTGLDLTSGTVTVLYAPAIRSATTTINTAAATAPTTGQVLTATDSTHATWQSPAGGVSLTSNAPANVTAATAVVGTGTAAARDDHKHNIAVAGPSTLVVGGSNTAGSSSSLAPADHIHGLPAYGTSSGTFAQGNDSRLSDDRPASGIRSASTIVAVSSATAPSTGQVLTATDSTHATWQAPTGGAASDLATTGSNVNVSAAAPPSIGKVLTATDATHATWQTPTGGSSSGNPFVDAPVSPHADNDEFTGWSGWTVYDITAAAVMTDDGDGSVDPWTFPTSGHYRRKTVGSYILLQFPKTSNTMMVYKSITPVTNMLVWSRWASGANFNATTNSFMVVEFGVYQNNSGRPLNASFTVVGSAAGRKMTSYLQGVSQNDAITSGQGVCVPDIVGVFEKSTSSRSVFLVDSRSGDHQIDDVSPRTATSTTAYVGWRIIPTGSSATGGACPILSIDYFRRLDSSTAWIV